MTGTFGILESSATQWYQDVAPAQEVFLVVTSIVYAYSWSQDTVHVNHLLSRRRTRPGQWCWIRMLRMRQYTYWLENAVPRIRIEHSGARFLSLCTWRSAYIRLGVFIAGPLGVLMTLNVDVLRFITLYAIKATCSGCWTPREPSISMSTILRTRQLKVEFCARPAEDQ
jgi:hypothetical protein